MTRDNLEQIIVALLHMRSEDQAKYNMLCRRFEYLSNAPCESLDLMRLEIKAVLAELGT